MSSEPSPQLLARKLRECFPDAATAAEAEMILNAYGGQAWHREPQRVRLAMLMQCGGDLARLREVAALADRDFRDVLVGAEYPEEFRAPASTPPGEMTEIRRRDRARYQRWLDSGAT